MAKSFEDLVNDMVNIGIGVAATAADKSREVLDDLTARGAAARADARDGDFARSMADIFRDAGGMFTDVTARLSTTGGTVAERILDELILARVRMLPKTERIAFLAHVRDLVDSVDDTTVTVEVESDEAAESEPAESAAEDAAPADAQDAADANA